MQTVSAVIIGAGHSGLAMSNTLTAEGIDHIVVERGAIGQAWRSERWDSLTLLTPNWANGLPGAPYCGADPHGYQKVGAFAAGLTRYAALFGAPVQTATDVEAVSRSGEHFTIATSTGPICAKAVVLATGACAKPHLPAIAQAAPRDLCHLTPATYKRPDDLPQGGVLVVGASASGVQIAHEIQASGRPVTLAVGGHTRLPRTYRGRDIEWWLDALGVLDERAHEMDDLERARKIPSPQIVGGPQPVDLNALQELGVTVVGRLADIRDGEALFSGGLSSLTLSADLKMHRLLDAIDGFAQETGLAATLNDAQRPEPTRLPRAPILSKNLLSGEFGSVIWATGYRPHHGFINLPVFDRRGRLRHDGGVCEIPGLYALGLPFLRRRRSQQISGAGPDAGDLARHLVHHLKGAPRAAA